MDRHDHARTRRSDFVRDAIITLAAVVIAFLALDDITTDTARSFPLERVALAGCGAWFVLVALGLWRQRHRLLAGMSFGLIALAAFAQPAIGPGTVPSAQFAYLATAGGLVWFLLVTALLAGFASRPMNRRAA